MDMNIYIMYLYSTNAYGYVHSYIYMHVHGKSTKKVLIFVQSIRSRNSNLCTNIFAFIV